MKIGNKEFNIQEKTYLMGILNVTPDSFSDGGKYNQMSEALKHVEQMIRDGADIIDIGGESTRPGYTLLEDEEEINRVAPVIEQVKKNFDIPLSIDTYKSRVAEEAIRAGADLINDIWGLKYDNRMAEVIANAKCACCLMHNRSNKEYSNLIQDLMSDLKESIKLAKSAGIEDDTIIVDPGVGFAKSYEMNLLVMKHLEEMKVLGYPVLLGTSRKSMIGLTLDLPSDERVEGTIATTVMGVMKGCSFIRVHDVKENKRAIQMTEAILHAK